MTARGVPLRPAAPAAGTLNVAAMAKSQATRASLERSLAEENLGMLQRSRALQREEKAAREQASQLLPSPHDADGKAPSSVLLAAVKAGGGTAGAELSAAEMAAIEPLFVLPAAARTGRLIGIADQQSRIKVEVARRYNLRRRVMNSRERSRCPVQKVLSAEAQKITDDLPLDAFGAEQFAAALTIEECRPDADWVDRNTCHPPTLRASTNAWPVRLDTLRRVDARTLLALMGYSESGMEQRTASYVCSLPHVETALELLGNSQSLFSATAIAKRLRSVGAVSSTKSIRIGAHCAGIVSFAAALDQMGVRYELARDPGPASGPEPDTPPLSARAPFPPPQPPPSPLLAPTLPRNPSPSPNDQQVWATESRANKAALAFLREVHPGCRVVEMDPDSAYGPQLEAAKLPRVDLELHSPPCSPFSGAYREAPDATARRKRVKKAKKFTALLTDASTLRWMCPKLCPDVVVVENSPKLADRSGFAPDNGFSQQFRRALQDPAQAALKRGVAEARCAFQVLDPGSEASRRRWWGAALLATPHAAE